MMDIILNICEWYGATRLYQDFVSKMPYPFCDIYVGTVFLFILFFLLAMTIVNQILSAQARHRIKRKNAQYELKKLQEKEEQQEYQRYLMFVQMAKVSSESGISFIEWKAQQEQLKKEAEEQKRLEAQRKSEERKNKAADIAGGMVDGIKNIASQVGKKDSKEDEAPVVEETVMEPVVEENQTELGGLLEEEKVDAEDLPVEVVEEVTEPEEPEEKELVDIQALLDEKKKEQEAASSEEEGNNSFEKMMRRLAEKKAKEEQRKELEAKMEKAKETNRHILEEQIREGFVSEDVVLKQDNTDVTEEEKEYLERVKEKYEKEQAKIKAREERKSRSRFGRKKNTQDNPDQTNTEPSEGEGAT